MFHLEIPLALGLTRLGAVIFLLEPFGGKVGSMCFDELLPNVSYQFKCFWIFALEYCLVVPGYFFNDALSRYRDLVRRPNVVAVFFIESVS